MLSTVVHIQRRPQPTQFSVEGYFERVRSAWPGDFRLQLFEVPCFSRGLIPRVRNLLAVRNLSADVYHVTGDIQYTVLALWGRKNVLTVLDCEVLHRTRGLRRWLLKLFWYSLPLRFATRVTVISEETKRQLLRIVNYPADRIHVIPVSVSSRHCPTRRAFNSVCPRILQVGTKANKNVPRLVQAIRGLSCHLDIVGPVDESLERLIRDCQVKATFWGRLTDEELAERYREADIVAFVSTHEGFGMPIVEAQNVERVCITSNCSSMPEVAGAGACLVDPYDIKSIREGLDRIISSEEYRAQLLRAGALNRVRFDASTIAEQFQDVYRQVMSDSKTRKRG